MNNIDKALLLGESFGLDTTNFTSSYIQGIIESDAYINLCENVKWAENFNLKNSSKLITDFRFINYDVTTFEESVIFASRINYLSSVSGEEYYINPLISYSQPIKTRSIGDLMVSYQGGKHTFNDLISNETLPIAYKTNIVVRQAEYYRKEASEKALSNFEKTSNNKGLAHMIHQQIWKMIWLALIALVILGGSGFLFFCNIPEIQNMLRVWQFNNYVFYGPFIYFVFSLLVVLTWFGLFAYLNNSYSPYYYYKKLGRHRASKLYENINKRAQGLAEYIFQGIKDNHPLSNDIGKFNVATSDEELKTYTNMYKANKSYKYSLLTSFFKTEIIFCVIAALYTVACIWIERF